MSGIAGIFPANAPTTAALIDRMVAAMKHRARDGSATWSSGAAHLGHCWLNTAAETTGGPLVRFAGRYVVVADCRLDNRDELLARLGMRDREASDAEIILYAYLRWERACAERLEGDFAFAIWDGDRREFHCARDHFGVKPFYYHLGPSGFAFASEMKSLLATGVAATLDQDHVAGMLAGMPDDSAATVYSQVRRLPAGHCLSTDGRTLAVRQYYRIEPRPNAGPDAIEQFRHLFTEAVRVRMRGTQALGTMLSGGLDSSSIACVARDLRAVGSQKALPSYSMVFERGSSMDERPYIDAVLAQGGFAANFIPLVEHAPFREFETILDEQESTFLAPGLSATRQLLSAARNDGVRVLLDGHGGDEVVSHGYGRLHELAAEGRWLALWRELRGVARVHATSATQTYLGLFTIYGPVARLERARRRLVSRLSRQTADPLGLVNPDLARKTNLAERAHRFARMPGVALSSEMLSHRWKLTSGLISHAFEVLDKSAAHFGIEQRYPFWDKRLAEFCLSLPAEAKLNDGWTRYVLREAMGGILPPAVQWRHSKVNFGPNLTGGMVRNHRALLERTFGADSESIAPFVNIGAARAACERLLRDPDNAPFDEVQAVWRAASLSMWLGLLRRQGVMA